MAHYDSAQVEGTELSERDVRALEEYLTVLPDAPDIYEVVSQSGSSYTVDARDERCTCPDYEYRDEVDRCKHIRRVAFATGERSVPDGIDVDDQLGQHVDGAPRQVATDGGVVVPEDKRTRVPVSGGVLVYEDRDMGRELVGFEDVEDWTDLRDALAARGHEVGAANHLPELDAGESERERPRRSEPADFGGGETTGIQEL